MGKACEVDYSRKEDITVEEVKACAMFAYFTDEQAMEVVETIKRLTVIIYGCYQRKKLKDLD